MFKTILATVLGIGFAACGNTDTSDLTADELGETQEALSSHKCQVQSQTSIIETGSCWTGGYLVFDSSYCKTGRTATVSYLGGTLGDGTKVWTDSRTCN